MIEIKVVSKKFADITAIDKVDFRIEKGEVVGFLGPNGAGKTTMMRMITGFLEPTEGEIIVDGKSVVLDKISIKKKLGYLAENNPLYDEMVVFEYLKVIASLKGYTGAKRKEIVDQVVKETGIESVYYRPINELSKGFRQRVGLAQAILGKPEVLILDEPTEGLDPNQRVDIRSLITSLGKERTVIVSTHVLPEATAMCNRLIILDNGKVAADGSVDSLQTSVDQNQRLTLDIEAPEDIKDELKKIDGVVDIISSTNLNSRQQYVILADTSKKVPPMIFNAAKQKGWTLWNMHLEKAGLENVFRKLTHQE